MALGGTGAVVATARVLLRADTGSLQGDLRKAERDARTSAQRIGGAFDKTGSRLRGFGGLVGKTLGTVGKTFGSIASAATRMAKQAALALTAAGAALAVFVKKTSDAASDLSESINKTNVTFENSSKEMLKWSKTAADSLGLARQEALEGAASIGAMLKPMGLAPAKAADMSREMVQLAADMASFNNEDPTEMLDRIRAGLSGESEPLKRFGVLLSETRVKQFAWKTGIAESGEELTEQQKVLARYALLLSDSKDQQGDFSRTSDGLANSQRILTARWKDGQATLGRAFLPVMQRLTRIAIQLVPHVVKLGERFAEWLAPQIDKAVDSGKRLIGFFGELREQKGFKAKVEFVWAQVRPQVERLRKLVETVLFGGLLATGKGFKLFPDLVGKLQEQLEAVDWTGIASTVGDRIRDTLEKVDWVAAGHRVAEGVADGMVFTADHAARFATTMLDAIDRNIGQVADIGAELAVRIVGVLFDPAFWVKHWDLLLVVLSGVLTRGLGRLAAPLGKAVGGLLGKAFSGAGEWIAIAGRGIGRGLGDLVGIVARGLGRLPGTVGRLMRVGFIQTITDAVGDAVDAVKRGAVAVGNTVGAWASAAAGLARRVVSAVVDGVKALPGKVLGFFTDIGQKIVGKGQQLFGNAQGVGKKILDGAVQGARNLVSRIFGFFQDLGRKIVSWAGSAFAFAFKIGSQIVKGIISGIGNLGSKIWNSIKGGFSWLGSKLNPANWFKAGGIIGLATGGHVPMLPGSNPHTDSVLAMLQPGEVVVPVRTVAAMGGDFWHGLGIPGFQAGGEVEGKGDPRAPKPPKPRYGTFYLPGPQVFSSPFDRGTWRYDPASKKKRKLDEILNPPEGTQHVGPAGARAKGHPLSFPFWSKWWQAAQGDPFMQEWARRNRKGPRKFADQWARRHELAAMLLGIDINRVGKLEHWPFYRPPHPPGGRVGNPPGTGSGTGAGSGSGGSGPSVFGSAISSTVSGVGAAVAGAVPVSSRVRNAIGYANYIASLGQPYTRYGGHSGWDRNGPFDCSGFVSHVLKYGLGWPLPSPLTTYGLVPGSAGLIGGRGKQVTVWTRNVAGDPWSSHTVIQLLGQLYESGGVRGTSGGPTSRSLSGFGPSHPRGFRLGGIIPRFKNGALVGRRFGRSQGTSTKDPPKPPRKITWKQVAAKQRAIDSQQTKIDRAQNTYDLMARRFDRSDEGDFILVDDDGNETLNQPAIDARKQELGKLIEQRQKIVGFMRTMQKLLNDMVRLLRDLRGHFNRQVGMLRENLGKPGLTEEAKATLTAKLDKAREGLQRANEELPNARRTAGDYSFDIENAKEDVEDLRADLAEVAGQTLSPAEPADSFGDGGFDDSGGFGGEQVDAQAAAEEARRQAEERAEQQRNRVSAIRNALLTLLGEHSSNLLPESVLGETGHVFGSSQLSPAILNELNAQVALQQQLDQAVPAAGATSPAGGQLLLEQALQRRARRHPTEGGAGGVFSGRPIQIIQQFTGPPGDPHQHLHRAQAAARFARR